MMARALRNLNLNWALYGVAWNCLLACLLAWAPQGSTLTVQDISSPSSENAAASVLFVLREHCLVKLRLSLVLFASVTRFWIHSLPDSPSLTMKFLTMLAAVAAGAVGVQAQCAVSNAMTSMSRRIRSRHVVSVHDANSGIV